MSKILSLYTKDKNGNDIDRSWYDSSNVKYSECIDYDNKLKTLRVIFKNGTQYEYIDVDVNDFILFRESASQGKALNEHIKSKNYSYKKLDDVDMGILERELQFRLNGGFFVSYVNGILSIKDCRDNLLLEKKIELTKEIFDTICSALECIDGEIMVEKESFENEQQ